MATDRRLGPETNVSSPRPTTETGGPVRELVEALTAIGNYLGVADRILAGGTTPATESLCHVLDKSMGQYERAANAARHLNKLLRGMDSGRSAGPAGTVFMPRNCRSLLSRGHRGSVRPAHSSEWLAEKTFKAVLIYVRLQTPLATAPPIAPASRSSEGRCGVLAG